MSEIALSLFPGVDGLGLGFQEEWPELCVVRGPDVLWGSLHDVRHFHPKRGVFAGMFGGPPCQEFSPLARLVRAQGKEPRFGNLIPEFERCIEEGQPDWWVMEQVPQAPEPRVPGYVARHLILNNRWFADPLRPDGQAMVAQMTGARAYRKRCHGCGRFLSERQVSGYDLKLRWFFCEPCALAADARRFRPAPEAGA